MVLGHWNTGLASSNHALDFDNFSRFCVLCWVVSVQSVLRNVLTELNFCN